MYYVEEGAATWADDDDAPANPYSRARTTNARGRCSGEGRYNMQKKVVDAVAVAPPVAAVGGETRGWGSQLHRGEDHAVADERAMTSALAGERNSYHVSLSHSLPPPPFLLLLKSRC